MGLGDHSGLGDHGGHADYCMRRIVADLWLSVTSARLDLRARRIGCLLSPLSSTTNLVGKGLGLERRTSANDGYPSQLSSRSSRFTVGRPGPPNGDHVVICLPRTTPDEARQTWKACWGRPLKGSNPLSSAPLTSTGPVEALPPPAASASAGPSAAAPGDAVGSGRTTQSPIEWRRRAEGATDMVGSS